MTITTDTTTSTAPGVLDERLTYITDAGMETWLVFDHGIELPAFASYPLLDSSDGRALLRDYYLRYLDIAASISAGVILETPTWRANPEWAATLGHDRAELGRRLGDATAFVAGLRAEWHRPEPFVVSGTVGPRGDGYRADTVMTPAESADYHGFQISRMADAGVDMISAFTMADVGEAAGIALAAQHAGLQVVLSFTVETDGRLPSGMPLGVAITTTDELTDGAPRHYMVNCAHPTHFDHVLDPGASWTERIGGIRANASTRSHAELDEMVELDDGDPIDLADRYVGLRARLPRLHVLGGCCGTDDRHVAAIAAAWDRAEHDGGGVVHRA
jgi:homocysteine S-methyltransferase